jgi:hypothetical protein
MGKEPKDVLERKAHKFTIGAEVVAVLSILLLVPFLRRRREQRHGWWVGRFVIPGH